MYRGITLSSCVSKLFERVLVDIGEASNKIKSNQKALIVSSTVIKIHNNHGNIRHSRNM